ncbi:dihydroorotase family protein [Brachyspira hyodysenteriae]|uniref:dihydroorotase n=1 Tax=Brachyspira hyodysenteriae TaxID=159 RepID=UPI00063DC53A|nr:dihydroorotase family protein [Brachyspira hyodysenteriae]KLI13747.1 dihydroorotase [Brachyspira hyodysenteriae]KLI34778.1 dihydroorotase [Brachyspira hyodysenteriae]KLI37164.1 dihydroorotase [Brachyspira hyodysenteriae]MDA0081743.1 dihydroorotase family protein [Brachyspira hyodysenteriae]QTM09596.1 amidohydrolase family protein [Brachyspira hyodysenteriae]
MIIKNAKIVNNDKIVSIIIENEKIKNIDYDNNFEKYLSDNKTDDIIIDANYNYVLSGIIDPHTHMRDPGLTHKEDFNSGSKACARGGITVFLDMPNTIPNTISKENLIDKKSMMIGKSYVDYGFHFGGSKADNSNDIKNIINEAASTKIFFNASTGNMLVEDDKILEKLFEASKIVTVHAEDKMVDKAIKIAKNTNTPLYLCHLSLESEIDSLRKAKDSGMIIYGEATPHHLFLNTEDVNKNDRNKMLLRMKPELREKSDNKALWDAILDGTIDTIGTDHAPHLISEKLEKLTFGIPSAEHSLELMLKKVNDNTIDLKLLTKIMSEKSAEIFSMKDKGLLKENYDADLVIIDLNDNSEIEEKDIITKAGWSPYIDFKRGGKVLTTIVRGNIVYNNGKFTDNFIGKEITYSN